MPTRDELIELVRTLPDEALPAAKEVLTQMQTWPPPVPEHIRTRAEAFEQMQELRREQLRDSGVGGVGGGYAMFSDAPDADWESRSSFSYDEDGEAVHETAISKWGCDFTLIERVRRDIPGRQAVFIVELSGPGGVTSRHEQRFDLPA